MTATGAHLDFDGQVVAVTGAGRGIGRGYAMSFARLGAAVVVNDILGPGDESGSADRTVADITDAGGRAVACNQSVATSEGAAAVVQAALDEFGRIDAVVSNAGLVEGGTFPEQTDDEFRLHFGVHVMGSVMVARAAWPHFVAQGSGKLLHTTSGSVFGLGTFTAYAVAKGGVFALTRLLATQGEPHGIQVNSIMPSADRPGGAMPQRGVFVPEIIAPVAAWLCHPSCTVTGETIAAGGGRVSRVFLGESRGFADAALTIDMVRDRWAEVTDLSDYDVPASGPEHRAISGRMAGE